MIFLPSSLSTRPPVHLSTCTYTSPYLYTATDSHSTTLTWGRGGKLGIRTYCIHTLVWVSLIFPFSLVFRSSPLPSPHPYSPLDGVRLRGCLVKLVRW